MSSSGYDFADEDPFADYQHDGPDLATIEVPCPKCNANAGDQCDYDGRPFMWNVFHADRAELRDQEYRRLLVEDREADAAYGGNAVP